MIHIVNISGGKDSAVTRLLAIERGIEHVAVFADTGNEHPSTEEEPELCSSIYGLCE